MIGFRGINPLKSLAQVDLSTLEGQTSVLIERLASPLGFAAFLLGIVAVALILPRRRGLDLGALALLFILSFPLHYTTLARELNTLIAPLQALRSTGRPLAYALITILAVRALLADRGHRERLVPRTAVAFLAFQLFYVAEMAIFDNFAKGTLSVLSVLGMFLVFCLGLGREMQDASSARDAVKPLGWLAVAFVLVNIVQLTFGFGASFVGGRLAGISGNAQFMGGMCCIGLLATTYFQTDPVSSRAERSVYLAVTVALVAFLIASGSRGNALAAMAGLLAMHRARLGSLLLLGSATAALALLAVVLLVGEEGVGAGRMLSTENTRALVFERAIRDFRESPLFGSYWRLGDVDSAGVESSFLRALVLLGLPGGAMILFIGLCYFSDILVSWRMSRARADLSSLCNFHIGLSISMITINLFEGIAFGVLTLPVMVMHLSFGLGAFIRERSWDPLAEEPQ